MSERSKAVGRGVVTQVGGRLAGLIFSLVTVATSTQYLGVERYGLLTGAIVIVGVFESLTELGIGQVIVRRVSQGKGQLAALSGTQLGLSLFLGPAVAVLAVLVGYMLTTDDPTQRLAVAIIAVGLIFTALARCGNPIFQVQVRFGASAIADVSSRGLALAGTLVVAALDLGVLPMAAVQVIHPFVRMVVSLVAAGRMQPWKLNFDRSATWSLVKESLPITAMLIVGVLYWRADGLILQALSDNAQLAAYGVALAIAGNLNILPQVLANTTLSTLAERHATDRAAFNRTCRTIYQLLLVIMLPVAVFGWVLADEAIELLSGAEYVPIAAPVLQLFFVGMALGFLNPLLSTALFSAGKQSFLLRMALVTLAVNIAAAFLLIPPFGAVGAGLGLVASELLGVTASTYMLLREGVRLPAALDVARILPAISLGLAMTYIMRDVPVVFTGLVVVVLYGGAVVATGAMPHSVVSSLIGRKDKPSKARETVSV